MHFLLLSRSKYRSEPLGCSFHDFPTKLNDNRLEVLPPNTKATEHKHARMKTLGRQNLHAPMSTSQTARSTQDSFLEDSLPTHPSAMSPRRQCPGKRTRLPGLEFARGRINTAGAQFLSSSTRSVATKQCGRVHGRTQQDVIPHLIHLEMMFASSLAAAGTGTPSPVYRVHACELKLASLWRR